MPAPVSKKQYRFMQAVLHGYTGHPRGVPPKGIAENYVNHAKGTKISELPESKDNDTGGHWNEHTHGRWRKTVESRRHAKKKNKPDKPHGKVKKSLDDFAKGQGAGCIVVDNVGRILLGRRSDTGDWATPGGHVEPGESYDQGALRELAEETGLVGKDPVEFYSGHHHGNDTKSFIVYDYSGKVQSNGEMKDLRFFEPHELPWDSMRAYAAVPIRMYIGEMARVTKSLKYMIAEEQLQKNIIRSNAVPDAVHELTHGDALKVVGNSAFRFLRNAVKDMADEEFRDVHLGEYTISIRKHTNDVYSGRIVEGHKTIHQFTNRSLPALTAELMSVFEWYLPEDEKELHALSDTELPDDAIKGGLSALMDHYKRHNIANIYDEMENIRAEIRHGNAVDLQQVEARIMKLFDRMEETLHSVVDKHNELSRLAGKEIDDLESKLRELQARIDEMGKKPETIEAYSRNPPPVKEVHDTYYPYLPRPSIEVSPDGRLKISFGGEWTGLEKENFLKDMRAKVIKKAHQ